MTIDLFIERLDALGKDLPHVLTALSEAAAGNLHADIQQRIGTEGINAHSTPFGGRAKRLGSDGVYSQQHEKLRKEKRRRTDFMDFSFTGDMWESVQHIETKKSGYISVVTGATGGSNREKMQSNFDREGDILEASKSEVDKVVQWFDERLQEEIDKRL